VLALLVQGVDVAENKLHIWDRWSLENGADVWDWEKRFALLLADQLRTKRCDRAGRSWYVDETYIKVLPFNKEKTMPVSQKKPGPYGS
jgi:hypothetical protein